VDRVTVIAHPLVQYNLGRLRDQRTEPEDFRRSLAQVAALMIYEATRSLETRSVSVTTPLAKARAQKLSRDVVLVPVLRAGLGMLDAVLELLPSARVGHIGLQRDEATAIASRYYSKLPSDLRDSYVLMIDPMLATGGSAVAAIDMMKAAGARTIRMICIVAAPDGVALVETRHPDVPVYTPVVDSHLDAHKYIVPGLGDFGDRLYGTQ
jgi:uracil phosphoribosyltransferase